ncbi:MAG: hypothetical protein ACTFAK_02845 [Candidatus Electronema sp. VV]
MAGRFEGLTDVAWEVFRNIFPSEEQGGRGRPAAPSRNILNSLLAYPDCRLPVVRPSAKAAMGIKKLKPPAAQVMGS